MSGPRATLGQNSLAGVGGALNKGSGSSANAPSTNREYLAALFSNSAESPSAVASGDVIAESAERSPVVSWTPQEVTMLEEVFSVVASQAPILFMVWESSTAQTEHAKLVQSLLNFAQKTGTLYDVIKGLITLEFEKASDGQLGSIMRGNSVASRMGKEYLRIVGQNYLHLVLDDILRQVSALDYAAEMDPMKLEPAPADREHPELDPMASALLMQHKEVLVNLTRSLVESICRSSQNMPDEIKYVTNMFADSANRFAPEQFFSLIGGFLILRFINPALSTPDQFGMTKLSDGTQLNLTPHFRRNLILVAKILQNLSNGQDFGKKEPYMICFNDFVRANSWKVENFFREVVAQAPNSLPEQIRPDALTDGSVTRIHYLLTHVTERALTVLPSSVEERIQSGLEKLKSLRTVDNFLDAVNSRGERGSRLDAITQLRFKIVIETPTQTYESAVSSTAGNAEATIKECLKLLQKLDKKKPAKTTPEASAASMVVFGQSLPALMALQKSRYPQLEVPKFFSECVAEIIRRGLEEPDLFFGCRLDQKKEIDFAVQENVKKKEGRKLFKKSGKNDAPEVAFPRGNAAKLTKLSLDLQALRVLARTGSQPGTQSGTPSFRTADIASIAELLVAYIHELPAPVIPMELLQETGLTAVAQQVMANSVTQDEAFSPDMIHSIVRRLSKEHQHLLSELCRVLAFLKQNYKETGVHSGVLASVFGPVLTGLSKIPAAVANRKEKKTSKKKGDDEPDLIDVAAAPFLTEAEERPTVGTMLVETLIDQYEAVFADNLRAEEKGAVQPLWRSRTVAHPRGVVGVRSLQEELFLTWAKNELRVWFLAPGSVIPRKATIIDNDPQYDVVLDIGIVKVDSASTIVKSFNIWVASPVAVRVWTLSIRQDFVGVIRGASPLKVAPECIQTMKGHGCSLLATGGSYVAGMLCENDRVVVWDSTTFLSLFSVSLNVGGSSMMLSGQFLWVGLGNGSISVFNVAAKAKVSQLAGVLEAQDPDGSKIIRHERRVRSMVKVSGSGFAPETVWTASEDGIICIWEGFCFTLLHSFNTHSGKIGSMRVQCGAVWCPTWERSVRAYSIEKADLLADLKGRHEDGVTDLTFCIDTAREQWKFISVSYDHTMCVWLVPRQGESTGRGFLSGDASNGETNSSLPSAYAAGPTIDLSSAPKGNIPPPSQANAPSIAYAPISAVTAIAPPPAVVPSKPPPAAASSNAGNVPSVVYGQFTPLVAPNEPTAIAQQPPQASIVQPPQNSASSQYARFVSSEMPQDVAPALQTTPQLQRPPSQTFANVPVSKYHDLRPLQAAAEAREQQQQQDEAARAAAAAAEAERQRQESVDRQRQALIAAEQHALSQQIAAFQALPYFHNISGSEGEAILQNQPGGSYLVRFSSKPRHLAVTFVMLDDTIQNALVAFDTEACWSTDEPNERYASLADLIASSPSALRFPMHRQSS